MDFFDTTLWSSEYIYKLGDWVTVKYNPSQPTMAFISNRIELFVYNIFLRVCSIFPSEPFNDVKAFSSLFPTTINYRNGLSAWGRICEIAAPLGGSMDW